MEIGLHNTACKTAAAELASRTGLALICAFATWIGLFNAARGQQIQPDGYSPAPGGGAPFMWPAASAPENLFSPGEAPEDPEPALPRVAAAPATPTLAQRVSALEAAVQGTGGKPAGEPDKAAAGPSLHLRGHLLMDAVAFSQDDADKLRHQEQNAVGVPVARLIGEGDITDAMSYKVEFDYVWNIVGDLYMTIGRLPYVGNLRIGHMKEPFSLEQLESPKYTVFMERSLARELHPAFRRMGAMVFDTAAGERATWAIGLFSDASGFRVVRADAFGGALTMRASYLPWYDEASSGRRLLHTAIAYSHRQAARHVTRFRTWPGSHFASFIVDTGDIPARAADLLNVELALVQGPFSIQSEYTVGWIDALTQPDFKTQGCYVLLSHFLTGENRHYVKSKGVFSQIKPFRNFIRARDATGCLRTGPGAWELKYRYSYLDAFDGGRLGAQQAGMHAVGVNWYLNPYSRFMAEYIIASSSPNNGEPDGLLNIFQVRGQFEF